MNSKIIAILALLAGLYISGCKDNAKSIQGGNQQLEQTSTANQTAELPDSPVQPEGPDVSESVKGKFIRALYSFKATVIGLGVCEGELLLEIDPLAASKTGKLIAGAGKASCPMIGKDLDFEEMLGGGDTPPTQEKNLVIKGATVGIKQIGAATFSPYRPMFPSFLAGKPKELSSLDKSVNASVVNSALNEQGQGTIRLRTLEFGNSYESPSMKRPYTFKKTMRFESVVSGFDTVKVKTKSMLFERMEMVISLAPVSIPYINFSGSVSEFTEGEDAGAGGAGAGGALGGLLGGGAGGTGGGGALGGIVDVLKPLLMKLLKVKAEFHLIEQDGIDYSKDD